MVGPSMYLISETHYLCEMREYAFNILPVYNYPNRASSPTKVVDVTKSCIRYLYLDF